MPGRHGKLQWMKQRKRLKIKKDETEKKLCGNRLEWKKIGVSDFRHLLLLATRRQDNPDLSVGKACHNPLSFEES